MTAANVSQMPAPKSKKKASVEAREAEAGDGYVTVEQCGVTLRIPVGGRMPLKAYMAFRDGDETKGTELLLGPEQWEALLAQNPTLDDMNEIGRKLEESSGN